MSINSLAESENLNLNNYMKLFTEEEDFEFEFNEVSEKDEPIEDISEQISEIKNIWNIEPNTFTKKEEPLQIYNSLQSIKDINLNEEDINKKKNVFFEENDEKEINNIEIEIKEDKGDEMKEIKNDKKQENESNIIPNKKNANIFRTYNSQDFTIFHPGGIVEYYKYIKYKIKEESLNQKKKKDIFHQNQVKFNVYIKNKKDIFRKKAKERKKRKEKPDNIRKKIKSRFLKILKNRINEILKNAKSDFLFDNLPQCFISNISKNGNIFILDMTLKELLSKNFFGDYTSTDNSNETYTQKKRNPNKAKYDKNQKVLEYLESNSDIRKSSNFNVISKLTFRKIFKEYLKSEEFENDILELKNKNNSEDYIKEYINKAENFLDYFSKNN